MGMASANTSPFFSPHTQTKEKKKKKTATLIVFQYFVVSQDIFTMASFYYNYQNPSGFCFFMLIRAIVLCRPLGLQNLNLKRKTK